MITTEQIKNFVNNLPDLKLEKILNFLKEYPDLIMTPLEIKKKFDLNKKVFFVYSMNDIR